MAGRLIDLLSRGDDPDLREVATAETMRDVADATALTADVPPEWTTRADIVSYGEDVLTDVLVFRHAPTRQELVVVPESNADPTGPVRFYHHDRTAGHRRRLPADADTLEEGLDYLLDRIETFERVFGEKSGRLPGPTR